MRLTVTRRFAEALGSWMHFEACCFRGGLFSESSFKSALGSVASSLHAQHRAARVHADYALGSIQKVPDAERKIGGGRKRSVDFAIIHDDGRQPPSEPELLIEAKWAGSSHCSTANVTADFIRLCIMKRAHPDAIALFILAGHAKDVDKVLSKRPFAGGRNDVIRYNGSGTITKFKFASTNIEHQRAFAAAISGFHSANLRVPAAFSTTGSLPYPGKPAKFKAAAWEVYSVDPENLAIDAWPISKKKPELAENVIL